MSIRAKWETRNDDENIMILHVDYRLWEPPPPAVDPPWRQEQKR